MVTLLVVSLLAGAPLTSAATVIDRVGVSAAVQSKGTVYALRGGALAWFDGAAWRDVTAKSDAPVTLISADHLRGGVVALHARPKSWELWRYWEGEGGRFATGEAPLPAKPRLFATSTGSVWIVGDSRRLIEVSKAGKVQVHLLEASWLVAPEAHTLPACTGLTANGCCEATLTSGQVYCGSVRVFEANGAVWFWSKGSSNSYVLPGVLKYNGVFTPWTKGGLPNAVTRAVLPVGGEALLASDGVLSRLDLKERTASPEPFPPLKEQSPQNILALVRSRAATWALVERSFQQRAGLLFRRASSGSTFERTLEGVGGSIYPFMEDPIFAFADGPDGTEHAWLAPPEGAPWHFTGTSAELLDWSRGVTFVRVTGLFVLPGGRLLLTDASAGSMVIPAWGGAPAPSATVKRLPFMDRVVTWTRDRHFWWLEERDPLVLQEWTGRDVVPHPAPANVTGAVFASNSTLFADGADQLWVAPEHSGGYPNEGPPTLRYVPTTGAWVTAPSYVEAVKLVSSTKGEPVTGWDTGSLPAVQRDGTWCFSDPRRALSCVFPGATWRRWTADEVSGVNNSNVWTSPALTPDGGVTVIINHLGENQTFLRAGTSWKATEPLPLPPPPPAPPPHCHATSSAVTGDDGRVWFSAQEVLMIARGEVCRPRLEGVAMPYSVSFARFDAASHDVLAVGSELLVFTDDTAFPKTNVTAPKVTLDTVRLVVSGAVGAAEFRVDSGLWETRSLDSAGQLLIDGLRRGPRRIDVRALDAHLRADPKPVTVQVTISYLDAALVETLLGEARMPELDVARLARRMRPVAALVAPKLAALKSSAQPSAGAALEELIRLNAANL